MKLLGKIITAPLDFITKYFKSLVFILILVLLFAPSDDEDIINPPNLAKLYLTTPIFESESFEAQIARIKKNKSIKGVLLIIDSPGGSVSASLQVADMIKNLSAEIPVVAYVQGSMASGSYYAGMYANEIYANRGALIGSIGVIFSSYNIQSLMDKIGIKEQGLKAGRFKEVGTSTREWTEEEYQYLEQLIQEQYKMFWQEVLSVRKKQLVSKNYEDFAEGKIFTAHNALNLGLIDGISSKSEAISKLLELSKVENPIWLKKDRFENYMDKFFDSASSKILSLTMPSLKAIMQ
ncbi:signal peptide peptidase SppA [Helicobacter sp. MIT 05-5293]|uniref:signal peptide peptidase SppA n=1 Tax=Helicobacter sp. MIT 05-5293 TaxID=1548149 RepID=UPI00051CE6C7|nr:signal peptide peptidase SppA [Helicobacter sp. MIT 05-5293]TLD82100.1 signal peptide peptidase SppA [Helicobacter sp. MIT 05-5293]